MKLSVLRGLWNFVTGPFLMCWIVYRTVNRGRRRSMESGIPFLHAWLLEIDDWLARVAEEERAIKERKHQLQQEAPELEQKLNEVRKESDRKMALLRHEVDRLGPERVLEIGRELAREKNEGSGADS